jgi:hypothetical protein
MDLSQLLLIAARVIDVPAERLLQELDLEAAQSCLETAAEQTRGEPVHQASALLHAIVQSRPFGEHSDAVALIAAAHILEEADHLCTFQPTESLWQLLERIRSNDATINDVVNFVQSKTDDKTDEEKTGMFERFTPPARQAMSEAKHAAKMLHHNFIGTEHVLLGLLAVEEGIGAQVLREFGVAGDEVRRQVEALVGPGPKAVVDHFPFTPRSKKTLELALRNALGLGHDYIGTEHILLGILEVREGIAARILEGMGLTRRRAEDQIISALLAQGWTPPSKKARRRARHRAFEGFTLSPTSPGAAVRNQRLVNELTTIIKENDALRAEVSRLRQLLAEHDIDPGLPGAGEQPAS